MHVHQPFRGHYWRMFPIIFYHVLFILATAFAIHNSSNHPVSDAFYHIKAVVIPYHNHTLNVLELFRTRGPSDQPHVLYKLFLLANYQLFNLDFRIELLFGLLGIYLSSCLLLRCLSASLSRSKAIVAAVAQLFVVAKLVSFNSNQHFLWSLVTFDYCMLTLSFLVFVFASRLAFQTTPPFFFYSMASMALVFGSTTGELGVAAVGAGFLILAVVNRRKWLLRHALWTFFLILAFKVLFFLLKDSGPSSGPKASNDILSFAAAKFTLHWLAQGVLAADYYKNALPVDFHIISLAIGAVVAALNVYSIVLYFKNRLYLATLFPLFLQTFTYGTLVALLIGRFAFYGADYALQPRYVRLAELNIIALAWVFGLHASKTARRLGRACYIIPSTVLLLVQMAVIPSNFKQSPWIVRYHKAEEREIRALANGEIENATMPRINVYGAKDVSRFLKENKLSLFDGEF